MKETHAKINLKPKDSMCWTVRKRTHFRMFRILLWYLIHTEPERFFQQELHYLSFHMHSPHRLGNGYNVKYRTPIVYLSTWLQENGSISKKWCVDCYNNVHILKRFFLCQKSLFESIKTLRIVRILVSGSMYA